MRKIQKNEMVADFTGPLWTDRATDLRDTVVLEELVKRSHEDPDSFCREWVAPLLAEGMELDGIFDLLLDGAARPN